MMHKRLAFLFFFLGLVLLPWTVASQSTATSEITLEDVWRDYTFYTRSVPGFNFQKDGKHFTRLDNGIIQQYDFATGNATVRLFEADALADGDILAETVEGYTFSEDEKRILLSNGREPIYRHSSRDNFYVYDGKRLQPVYEAGKQQYASFNPQADRVAFVYENNLYVKNLKTDKVTQITTDGKENHIINGATDWVYEEEFSFWKGYQWSPDGRKIAFYRFDEREVPEFTMQLYTGELYPKNVTWKYPKVGEPNSEVTLHIYDLETGKTVKAQTGTETDIYFPRIKWTKDPNQLCIYRMNRHQNELELLLADATTGTTQVLLRETNPYYIEIDDNLRFLKDGKHFIWTSERDGYNHLYLYDMEGKLQRQLTKGKWIVSEFYGVDEANGKLYYQAAERSPLQREVYEIDLKGKQKRLLTPEPGWNSAQFSSTFDYFVNNYSTANQPPAYTVYDRKGKVIRKLETNQRVAELQTVYNTQPLDFFAFKTSEGVDLNGYMIQPPNFDETKEYPVFMFVYGGPGSQQVTDRWKGQNYWWFQMLAQQGYLVACVDNRGTGGRGQEFQKSTYLKLGDLETRDQIEAANYLGQLPYADADRIGIFGWSYGGYMSSLCLLKGNDTFKSAIAVAPVTHWKWYDTIYTERYMRTVTENPDGYAQNSPVNFADRLRGNFLLVHGIADDNVHYQHAVELSKELIKADKQFDSYAYPNRNHGIYGDNARLHLYRKMTNFLNEQLKGNGGNYNRSTQP